jgi:DNA-binding NtrC family response regulator
LIHTRLESLIDEMLEGHILLDEAICEFEKLYIKKALARHKQHLSKTAAVLGIHRNTLAKRVASYKAQNQSQNGTKKYKTRAASR